ncbi:MAG: hypothetical protein ACI8PZ_000546 [Myxococcota bacterium]|jgi:hypothetical protein
MPHAGASLSDRRIVYAPLMLSILLLTAAFAQDPAAADPPPAPPNAVATAPDAEPEKAQPWDRVGWGWGGLPAVNYNSDEGFGAGIVASLYRYNGELQPYKTAFDLILFATTFGGHAHSLTIDWLEVSGEPVRITTRIGLAATRAQPYCGLGSTPTCDTRDAVRALGLDSIEDDEDAVRRFYQLRYVNPNARADVRWAFDPMPHRMELLAGYRFNYLIPGTFTEAGPWPGSLWDLADGEDEEGLVSVLQTGVMFDNRDNEPAPTSGYWHEVTIRGAHKFWASDYNYFGYNLTARTYLTLAPRLVWANRVVLDGIVGDAHIEELGRPGGTVRYYMYGEQRAGRGIRLTRFAGRVKNMEQTELRWTFISAPVFKIPVDITLVGFGDFGFVAQDWRNLNELARPLPSTGGGLRFAIDKNFIVRTDVGVSAFEDWSPSIYIDLKNLF